MKKRQIINFNNLKFEPFDNYGVVVPGMSWHKISYSKENGGQGITMNLHPLFSRERQPVSKLFSTFLYLMMFFELFGINESFLV